MLLPLTESLYVSGTLESVETVLLEVGTGYYVEVRGRAAPICLFGGWLAVFRGSGCAAAGQSGPGCRPGKRPA